MASSRFALNIKTFCWTLDVCIFCWFLACSLLMTACTQVRPCFPLLWQYLFVCLFVFVIKSNHTDIQSSKKCMLICVHHIQLRQKFERVRISFFKKITRNCQHDSQCTMFCIVNTTGERTHGINIHIYPFVVNIQHQLSIQFRHFLYYSVNFLSVYVSP